MAKFAPLALGPLYITHTRRTVRFAVGMGIVLALSFVFVLAYGDPRTFFDRTLGFQTQRGSPFSIWGLRDWTTAQTIVQVAPCCSRSPSPSCPRRRDLIGLSALTAAVIIGLQLGITHWFYLYIVWFFGPLMVALLGVHGSSTWSMESRAQRLRRPDDDPVEPGSSAEVSNRTDIWVRSDSIA